jgi:hypothetical protein
MLLAAGCAAPTSAQDAPDPSRDPNAQALADTYAPVMYLAIQSAPCDKKGEAYFPAPVEMVLGNERIGLMDGDPPEEVARGASAADVFRLPKEAYLHLRPGVPGAPAPPGGDLRPRRR